MGGNPWHSFTRYQPDINAALQNLREQEFRAGRYGFDYWANQTMTSLESIGATFPTILERNNQKLSADELIEKHGSVSAAIEAILNETAPDGTTSILDIEYISDIPQPSAACPLSENELQEIFKTVEPKREQIEAILIHETEPADGWEVFWESIERGEGRYIIVYQEGQPTEIFFAGYSFD
jgi:hypothetical protein